MVGIRGRVFDKVLWHTKYHRYCPVIQCHDKIWPHWCNSKITWDNIVYAVLDFVTEKYNSVTNIKDN